MTDASFTATGHAILTEDDPNQKYSSVKKSYAPIAWVKDIYAIATWNVDIRQGSFSFLLCIQRIRTHLLGNTQTDHYPYGQQIGHTILEIFPPALWNTCDYVIQFNFVIAHIPGKNNKAADYLSRIKVDHKEKLILKFRKDIDTKPIEVNVQSTGVEEEEQVFFTEHDDETETQIWERKKQSRNNLIRQEAVIQIDTISENIKDEITNFTQKLRRTNQIQLKQSKDPILPQLKAKIQNEDYTEKILQQDIRYKHYLNNLDRIVLNDEIVTRQYYDKTGQIKHHQILLPKHLQMELLSALHGTAHKPGIFMMLQEIRQKYYYPGIAKHVKTNG